MIVDIVLLPPKAVSEKIGRFVRKLRKSFKLKMAVDNRKLLPHISLLHIKTLAKRVPAIMDAVRAISQKYNKQILKFTRPKIGKDYFVFDLAKSRALLALHKAVVMKTHEFKTGFSGVGNPRGDSLQRQYIKKYGAGNILKNFQPHITLGLVRRSQDMDAIVSVLSKQRWTSFNTNRLAITQVNHRHQVYKIIREFKLHE